MYLEEWAIESASGTSAKAHASCWGIHRSTHWRWARRPRVEAVRPPRLAQECVKAVVEVDARNRSSWDVRAIAHVTGVGKSSVAKILRGVRGPRPKPAKPTHARRTRFLARDVMWSSDFVVQPDGRKLLKTLDEASRYRLAWDASTGKGETAADVVRHARRLIERMGRAPLVWKYDHGSGFTSKAFQALLAERGIAGYPIPPRAPWANGRTERDHQEIKNWLAPIKDAAALEREIDDGMLMLNFVKPRAVLGYKTSAQAYFDDVGVPEFKKIAFRDSLRSRLAGSEDERLRRREIRAILAELGLYEEWLQGEQRSGSVNRTYASNVAT